MAMIKFRDCLASELASQQVINGSFILCRDTGDMYCDTLEGERITIAKTIHVVNGPISGELFPEDGHMYYSTSDRQVCVYHNGDFQPINISTCIKKIDGCYVAKNGNATISINAGVGSDRLDATYGGTIVNVIPHKLYTDISIADLDSQLVGNNAVKFNGVSHSSGVWSVTVANTNTTIGWLGSIDVMLFLVNEYNSQNV